MATVGALPIWRCVKGIRKRVSVLHRRREALEEKNTEMKPKALFADAVSASHTSALIGDLAKILRGNNIEIGQKRLFQWLRDNNYIIKSGSSKNMPKSLAKGRFIS